MTTSSFEAWFTAKRWQPFPFQREVWEAHRHGASGLIHAATGTGKTYAAWGAALQSWLDKHPNPASWGKMKPPALQVIWLTPLRALAADTAQALLAPVHDLGLPWTIELRTGDTSSAAKQRQLKKPPSALITTPESLSLLLSQKNAQEIFADLQTVVVDEWHELLGNKRGVQTELGLARLRRWRPELRTWGLSATLGNLDEALQTLVGREGNGRLIRGLVPKEVIIDSLIPDEIERFPWAGHMGLKMLPQVIAAIEEGRTALVFTNTRNQTERWFQAILDARPDLAGDIALHHGSLDRSTREWVEDSLREGSIRAVVCTSSLDLGVDFPTVDRVLQIGSPKGVARLLQRAGRSGHQPGVISRITCVPSHAFQLVEVAAVRDAVTNGHIEARVPPSKPLDLLVQHLVTLALGGGFEEDAVYAEIRNAYSYRDLTRAEFDWALAFVTTGGYALQRYPEYQRVTANAEDGRFTVEDRKIASRHRMSIGTIMSDPSIQVQYLRGGKLGTINESFISRLKPGDKFIFAGKPLEFVRVRDLTAWVKRANSTRGAIPRWSGTTLPISPELGEGVRAKLAEAADGVFDSPEMWAVKPILLLQARVSRIPTADELLIEQTQTRDGFHLFFYPFEGKLVHQGLAALVAYRLARQRPLTFTLTANDYGFELLADQPEVSLLEEVDLLKLFSPENLYHDIPASLNASEMAKRQFREIARVSGLIFQGPPGQQRSMRNVQSSSSILYDVFEKYDSENLLLAQANREVLERQLDASRLSHALRRIQKSEIGVVQTKRPSPFAFPLFVERMQARLSSETLAERVQRLVAQLEKAARFG